MIWPFKKKKPPIREREKRNFDNVPWKWIEVPGARAYHVFQFTNGLGLIVFKDSRYTFDGMEAYAITSFENGSFNKLKAPEVIKYNHWGGIGVKEVEQFCDEVRNLRRYSNN